MYTPFATLALSVALMVSSAAAASPAASQPAASQLAASQPAALPAAASQPAPAAALKPGLWEMSVVVENVAAGSRRQLIGRSCITASDSTNPQRVIPIQREAGMQCENRDLKRDGSNWVWAFSCKSPEAAQAGNGRLSILGASYLGRAEAELKTKGAKPVKLAQTYAGRWLQACS